MRLPWECHNQSQDTNWRHCVTGPELPFFHTRKRVLKIDQSVKMPWHRISMGVAGSCSSAPDKTNRFHVAVRLFSNRSQGTSKCGKNISDTLGCSSCATFLFLPHFDVICDLLLNRRTATWNLFVKFYTLLRSFKTCRWWCKRPWARFSKVPKTFRARKAICKTTTCLFCKAGLFIRCKGNKNQNNRKVSCLETPSFWRYKENYGTRNTPEKFRDFRETGPMSQ